MICQCECDCGAVLTHDEIHCNPEPVKKCLECLEGYCVHDPVKAHAKEGEK